MTQKIEAIYRPLESGDYEAFCTIRNQALETFPMAFAATPSEEFPKQKQRYDNTMKSQYNFIMGAFKGQELIGMAGFVKEYWAKTKHKGIIWGLFVLPKHMGNGIGSKLLKSTVEKAFTNEGLQQILLSVVNDNDKALALYKKAGFEPYGIERKALKVNEHWLDEIHMIKYKL